MPLVIKIPADAVSRMFGNPADSYYCGPVPLVNVFGDLTQQLATLGQSPLKRQAHFFNPAATTSDINQATRIPLVFRRAAELHVKTLNARRIAADLVEDKPLPLKWLQRAFGN